LSPNCRDPPTAMKDLNGNLQTSPEEIEKIALHTYKERLKNRPMREDLINMQKDKEDLCQLRLDAARKNKTAPWTMQQLEVVLNYLNKNKSRDPLGFANEIFRPDIAGQDLKIAVLKLINRIKAEQIYPEVLELCDISSIFKNKGLEMILTFTVKFFGYQFSEQSLTD
jgi:hypothetical protein